jgi:hypothetical protein
LTFRVHVIRRICRRWSIASCPRADGTRTLDQVLLVGGQVVAWFTEKTFLRNFALGIVALTTALFGVFGILWAILILKGASIAVKVFLAGMSFSLLFTVLRLAGLPFRVKPTQQ